MNRRIRPLLLTGIALTTIPPVAGFGVNLFSTMAAFQDLRKEGVTDPHALASHLGTGVWVFSAGLILGAVGLILLAITTVLLFRESARKNSP